MSAALLQLIVGSVLFSPMLLIAAGAYFGGRYFDGKDSKLSKDGVVATATVYDAGYDHVGSLLQGQADNKMDRANYQRNDSAKCTIYYRFVTQEGQKIEGSVNREYASLEDAKSEIGNEFEVVYSAADPSVYETRAGHTGSQSDAMDGIAIAFFALWLLSSLGLSLYSTLRLLKPKSGKKQNEKRKKKSQPST